MQTLKTTVIIPMAGRGSRFSKVGYTVPKPFIDVDGQMMVSRVVENIKIPNFNLFLVCQKQDITPSRKEALLSLHDSVKIIELDEYTQGTAETVLRSLDHLEDSLPLYIINSDQIVTWDHADVINHDADGVIVCFHGSGNNWSYVRFDNGLVCEVAEKRQISNTATAGVYYWNSAALFKKYAVQMIEKDIRVNGEFYVAPVYQELIRDGGKVKTTLANKIIQLGTPEELETFLSKK